MAKYVFVNPYVNHDKGKKIIKVEIEEKQQAEPYVFKNTYVPENKPKTKSRKIGKTEVCNVIPDKMHEAIDNLHLTRTMKGKALKLICLILQKNIYNKDFAAYIPLPAKYLEKVFNKEYHTDFFNSLKTAGIIECNEHYKQGSRSRPGYAKGYRLNQEMLNGEYVPVFYTDAKNGGCNEENGGSSNEDIFINREYYYNENCTETSKKHDCNTNNPLSTDTSSSSHSSSLLPSFSLSSSHSPSYHISSRLFKKLLLVDDLSSLTYDEKRMWNENEKHAANICTRLLVDDHIEQSYFELTNNLLHTKYEVSKPSALSWASENSASLIKDGRHFYIDYLERYIENKKRNIEISYKWQTAKLKNKQFYASRNLVNKRLDHNLTCASKHSIKVIKEDNDLVEIDIKNSQFAIHAYWMKQEGLCIHKDVQTYYEMCSQGILYEHLATSLNINRAAAKELMMEIAFSSEKNNTSAKASFRKNFPNVVAHIDGFKKEQKDYRLFSNELQQIEAEIVIDNLYPNIKELSCFCLTRHDSIITKRQDQEEVIKLIKAYFNHLEFKCVLDLEGNRIGI